MNYSGKGSLLLIGIGGYGGTYVKALRPAMADGKLSIAAMVDPMAEKAPDWHELAGLGIPRYDRLEDALKDGRRADLVVISTPIALHAQQSRAALAAGMPVLCEKPAAATLKEVDAMIAAARAARMSLAIGFQWSYSAAILDLKTDLMAGRYGRPVRFKTLVSWPRDSLYYARNRWAGRIRDDRGNPVLDSPVNNATAHYLHNMLFLLGASTDTAASPRSLDANLLRANPIENYDAACLKAMTTEGVEVLFYSAHSVSHQLGPRFELNCEDALVRFDGKSIQALRGDEVLRDYGMPEASADRKLFWSLASARGESVPPLPCTITTARPHALVVNGLQDVAVQEVPPARIRRDPRDNGATLTWVDGLFEAMRGAYVADRLPGVDELEWLAPSQTVDLCNHPGFESV